MCLAKGHNTVTPGPLDSEFDALTHNIYLMHSTGSVYNLLDIDIFLRSNDIVP